MEYRLTWTIDLEADSPEDAARKALAIHRDPQSLATVFAVTDAEDRTVTVDLSEVAVIPQPAVPVLTHDPRPDSEVSTTAEADALGRNQANHSLDDTRRRLISQLQQACDALCLEHDRMRTALVFIADIARDALNG